MEAKRQARVTHGADMPCYLSGGRCWVHWNALDCERAPVPVRQAPVVPRVVLWYAIGMAVLNLGLVALVWRWLR